MFANYQHWQATGLEEPMGGTIRNGVTAIVAFVLIAFASVFGATTLLSSREGGGSDAGARSNAAVSNMPAAALLANTGSKYVLEVRGLGVVVGRNTNEEIWGAIKAKADNFSSILPQSAGDYPGDINTRLTLYEQVNGLAFRGAAGRAVQYWPVPVIIWEPPSERGYDGRAASNISDLRQKASLGVNLFIWQADANTNDGAQMLGKLFEFFDKHPDAPAALVFSTDSVTARELLVAPGHGNPRKGHFVPEIPDSVVGILVSRSDRVDRLIRPFAVEQHGSINESTTQYDITRLWNFYWEKNDGTGADDFEAYYKSERVRLGFPSSDFVGTMSADWWQQQLPALWKQIGNKGPGEFKPSPYIPVRWTTWQVKQFDDAPLIGYLHRPVDVKLVDDNGKPLSRSAQAAALKSGWAAALGTLEPTTEPKRVFYDTTGDRQWAIPITQALSQEGAKAPDIGDVKQGYDIGRRIGNTGVSSPMVQLGLGLIASYKEGGASATIDRRPDGNATIMMVSPPDAATKSAWLQQQGGHDPF